MLNQLIYRQHSRWSIKYDYWGRPISSPHLPSLHLPSPHLSSPHLPFPHLPSPHHHSRGSQSAAYNSTRQVWSFFNHFSGLYMKCHMLYLLSCNLIVLTRPSYSRPVVNRMILNDICTTSTYDWYIGPKYLKWLGSEYVCHFKYLKIKIKAPRWVIAMDSITQVQGQVQTFVVGLKF